MLVCKGTFFVLFSKKNLCNCKKIVTLQANLKNPQ